MSDLPTGTVTFLFTDIEGSTRLWEEHPDAMRLALARHDSLLRTAIETEDGVVFKTVGDAFCAAFSTARQALSAAARIQQSLGTMQPSAAARVSALALRVRIGVHTGAAEVRDGDYFGPPLNRLARLLAIGHGGQVLLSEATHALVRHELPPYAALRDLGLHHLRDLGSPERVFQLLHPDLRDDFPRLRSLDVLPNNLPHQLTSFVGRTAELAEARALLKSCRLLTLTGAGGAGKSRLSIQVAAEALEDYPDGVWLVEFAPLSDPELVPQTIAETLEIREEAGAGVVRGVAAALREKKLLLLLDNCEHLLAAVESLVANLLRACPGVCVLATSRQALGIAGEQTYRVPGLSLPCDNDVSHEALGHYEAVRLFLERGRLADPHFRMSASLAPFVTRICRRLDGIPLALELAAARIGALPVEKLAERLDDSFRILTGGSRTALPQHRTLSALIDWSYDLLSEAERTLLRRLAVFAGGWTVEAAEAVCSDCNSEVLDLLMQLVEKSLVASGGAGGRYHLLQTVRQYAWDRVLAGGEEEDLRSRHQRYFLFVAEQAEPCLVGSDLSAWLEKLEAERDNLRAALEWSSRQAAGQDTELRLAGALWRFWGLRGYVTEGRARLAHAFLRSGEAGELGSRARALNGAGMLARLQGDYPAAESALGESLAIWHQLERPREISAGLNNLGLLAQEQRDHPAARILHEQSLEIRRRLNDLWGIAASLNNLGCIAELEGNLESAWALYSEALDANRIGGNREMEGMILTNLAGTAVQLGRNTEARPLANAGARIQYELGDRIGLIHCLQTLAYLAIVEDLPARAALLYGACERIRETDGIPIAPYERDNCLTRLAEARAKLGESEFSTAWNQGTALSLDETLAFALGDAPCVESRRIVGSKGSW